MSNYSDSPTRARRVKPIKFKQCIRYKKKSNGVKLVTFNANLDAAGCAALASALRGGALPALKELFLNDNPASDEAKQAAKSERSGLK